MHKSLYPVYNSRLPIYIAGMGVDFVQRGTNRPEGYMHYQISETVQGSGFLEFEGNVYQISQNQGFLIPPQIGHKYYPSEEGWVQNWVVFDGEGIETYLEALNLKSFMILNLPDTVLSSLLKRAMEMPNTFSSSVHQSALLIEMLCRISETHLYMNECGNQKIGRSIKYMNQNYDKMLTLDELAQVAEMSPQHFCKLFHRQTHIRPIEFLTKVRIGKSKELLLENPELSLREIAALTGFSSDSYFCKVFHNMENMTPSQFRKKGF